MPEGLPQPEWKHLGPVSRLVAIARHCAGWHLPEYAEELAWLVGRHCDPPTLRAQVAQWRTNCATSLLGMMAHACIDSRRAFEVHPLLDTQSKNGLSLSWVVQVMRDKGMIRMRDGHGQPTHAEPPNEPALLWYATLHLNNDHVGLQTTERDEKGVSEVVEGGGPNNHIGKSRRDTTWSWGRPLVAYLPVRLLGLPDAEQTDEERAAIEASKLRDVTIGVLVGPGERDGPEYPEE
jgi:hypothetical protein